MVSILLRLYAVSSVISVDLEVPVFSFCIFLWFFDVFSLRFSFSSSCKFPVFIEPTPTKVNNADRLGVLLRQRLLRASNSIVQSIRFTGYYTLNSGLLWYYRNVLLYLSFTHSDSFETERACDSTEFHREVACAATFPVEVVADCKPKP